MTYWPHSASADVDTGGRQRPCARGDRCLEGTAVPQPGAARIIEPALGYRALCDSDRTFLLTVMEALPGYYRELGHRIGDRTPGHGEKVSGSREAPIPVNVTVDELMAEMVNTIASWSVRVEDVAELTGGLGDRTSRGYTAEPFTTMCELLAAHLDAVLSLEAEPMTRFVTIQQAREMQAAGVPGDVHPHAGYAEVTPDLNGADAALELFKLNARCRWLLGYTSKDQKIAGRCLGCEQIDVLVRPDGAAGLADYAECSACGTRYFGAEYSNLMRDVYEQAVAQQRKEAS
jgi:hypothetical protein